jgi:predicted ABC-type ATPase
MNPPKVYTIFAGVNGSGKSTFYKTLADDFGVRVNVDEIIKERFNNDWQNPQTQMNAGRVAVRLLRECLQGEASFNQETTLTGHSILSNIKKAKENGFKIDLFYVGLESVELSIERVSRRIKKGGHGVSEDDLRRRYASSFENLKAVLPLCDKVQIYDNSREWLEALNPLLIGINGKIEYWDKSCPQYLTNVLDGYIDTLFVD